jgi:hypothetical protein
MIIGKVFGSNKGNSHDFAIRGTSVHVGLMIKMRHGSINQDKRCGHTTGVHEHSFADADLCNHIVATFFMDVNGNQGNFKYIFFQQTSRSKTEYSNTDSHE